MLEAGLAARLRQGAYLCQEIVARVRMDEVDYPPAYEVVGAWRSEEAGAGSVQKDDLALGKDAHRIWAEVDEVSEERRDPPRRFRPSFAGVALNHWSLLTDVALPATEGRGHSLLPTAGQIAAPATVAQAPGRVSIRAYPLRHMPPWAEGRVSGRPLDRLGGAEAPAGPGPTYPGLD